MVQHERTQRKSDFRSIDKISSLSHKDWQNMAADTAEIRSAAELRKEAKLSGRIAFSSSEADIAVIKGHFDGSLYTIDHRVMRVSQSLDAIIDTLVEIEKSSSADQTILASVLSDTAARVRSDTLQTRGLSYNPLIKKNEMVRLQYPTYTKALAWCLKMWLKASEKTGIGGVESVADNLKKFTSHLDDHGRAYAGRLIINQLNERYPLILANLCKPLIENSFQDLTKLSKAQ